MRRALIPDDHTARALSLALRFPRDQQAHLQTRGFDRALGLADLTMLAGNRRPGWDVAPTFKWRHAAWLQEFGITVLRGARAMGWDEAGRLKLGWDPEAKRPEDEGPLGSMSRKS